MLNRGRGGLGTLTALAVALACNGVALGATLTATADTYIWSALPDNSYGGANLWTGSAADRPSLVQFDLTAYTGQTVTGPATI